MRSPRARANSMLHGCHAYIIVQQYATQNHKAQDNSFENHDHFKSVSSADKLCKRLFLFQKSVLAFPGK